MSSTLSSNMDLSSTLSSGGELVDTIAEAVGDAVATLVKTVLGNMS